MKLLHILTASVFVLVFNSNVHATDTGIFSKSQVCKAAIAEIMGRDPSIIRQNGNSTEIIHLSYVRPADLKLWKYKCKIEGNRIIWSTDTGRWRTHKMDDKVTFYINGNSVLITLAHYDGSSSSDSFTIKQIGN